MSTVDIILLVIMGASIVRGYGRGLVMTIASMVSYIAGWWAALVHSDRVAALILQQEALTAPVFTWTRGFLARRKDGAGLTYLLEESLQESWQSLPLPVVAQGWLPTSVNATGVFQQTEAWLLDKAALALTQVVVSFIAFLLVFLVAKHVVFLVGRLLNGICQLPVLNALNRGGGLFAGLVRGVLMVWLVLLMATPFVAADPEGTIANALRMSTLLYYFNWFPFA